MILTEAQLTHTHWPTQMSSHNWQILRFSHEQVIFNLQLKSWLCEHFHLQHGSINGNIVLGLVGPPLWILTVHTDKSTPIKPLHDMLYDYCLWRYTNNLQCFSNKDFGKGLEMGQMWDQKRE